MHRNIIIIAVIAIVAFLAVLLIPRMLDEAAGGDEDEIARERDGDGDAEEGSVGSGGDGGMAATDTTPANPQLAAELQAAAAQVNAAGPVRIDEMTTMTQAEAIGNRIRYRYDVSRQLPSAQVQALGAELQRQNQNTICSRTETRALIDMGGEIEYAYYGPGNTFLFSTPIVDC